jgi:ubiquinone/menaquinone biosynthesis C-methylase UbiE
MDGRNIEYPEDSFDLVLERTSLHHVLEWGRVLDEMIRVSSKQIFVEEPIDDPRSEEKRNTICAQGLYLEVQKEVGFSHHKYLPLEALEQYFQRRNIPIEVQIVRSDELVDFDQYFDSFAFFAQKSRRKEYWFDRLDALRKQLAGKHLCDDDIVFIAAMK